MLFLSKSKEYGRVCGHRNEVPLATPTRRNSSTGESESSEFRFPNPLTRGTNLSSNVGWYRGSPDPLGASAETSSVPNLTLARPKGGNVQAFVLFHPLFYIQFHVQ